MSDKVMIVDDEESIIPGYERALKSVGIAAEGYTNPLEALEKLKVSKVDIILLDYYMDNFTGKEFIEKLREFDKETIVILQTGYADRLPPLETMQQLNVQGYYDKSKDLEELILAVTSALKTATLLKERNILKYEKEFIANLLISVVDEGKDQIMALGGQKTRIVDVANEIGNEMLKDIAEKIDYSLGKLQSKFKALDFADSRYTNNSLISEIFKTVEILTSTKAYIKFTLDKDNINVNCIGKYLVYILSEIAMYLYEKDKEQLEIICKNINDETIIIINKPYNYTEDILNKISEIALLDNCINVNVNDNLLEIIIK